MQIYYYVIYVRTSKLHCSQCKLLCRRLPQYAPAPFGGGGEYGPKQTRGGGLASGRLQHVAVILNDKNSD